MPNLKKEVLRKIRLTLFLLSYSLRIPGGDDYENEDTLAVDQPLNGLQYAAGILWSQGFNRFECLFDHQL